MNNDTHRMNLFLIPFSRVPLFTPVRMRHLVRRLLLRLSTRKRLVLGFLFPILVMLFALGSIGLQSYQLLTNVSIFNQHLLHAYTALTSEVSTLQLTHTNILGAVIDINKTGVSQQTIQEDQATIQRLEDSYDVTLKDYLQSDVLASSSELSALLRAAGHGKEIDEQRAMSNDVLQSWQAYQSSLIQVSEAIATHNTVNANTIEVTQTEGRYGNAMTSLQLLIQFTNGLVPDIHDATMVEENQLLLIMSLSVLCLLLAVAIVAWLVSSTLVQRLQRFHAVMQTVEHGLFAARVDVEGNDEITRISQAVNTTLDTVVGLLDETRFQRDELAKGKELKHLHESLQREHEALNEANTRLATLASTDMLTNLPNHRALQTLLKQEYERARRFGRPLSLLFFDGDRFKLVNDTYGHAVGDVVLCELSERARSVLRAGDTVGRFGGEEFLVLLPETNDQEAKVVAERLRSAVAALPVATHEVEGGIALTVSIGVASFPTDVSTASELREQADQAMYWAKRLGRNQVRTAAEAARANRDAALKAATNHALVRREPPISDEGHSAEQQMRVEQLRVIYSLMNALDWREPGMNVHAQEVSDLVVGMARLLHFGEKRLWRAATSAFLHDIGKIALPDRLLLQPQEHFSAQEWQLLHQHAELGAAIVEDSPWLSELAPAIRHHHERWDGTGTPNRLAGEDIPLEARLIAVAEAYHAMISEQPYQVAWEPSAALQEIERLAGTQFDPALLTLFRSVLAQRNEGTIQLSSALVS